MKYEYPTPAMAKLATLANYERYMGESSEEGEKVATGAVPSPSEPALVTPKRFQVSPMT